ncbi:MAG: hypothetical protein U5K84_04535 [Alkalibacterium sp.]|nr:hypothetical protein [Alkalibacterium sp.]
MNYLNEQDQLEQLDWLPENFEYYRDFDNTFGFDFQLSLLLRIGYRLPRTIRTRPDRLCFHRTGLFAAAEPVI